MPKLTLPSGRTVEEALDATYRRTDALRRRRWAARTLPLALVLVAGSAAWAAVSSGDPVAVTVADSQGTTTTEAVNEPAQAPTATTTTPQVEVGASTTTTARATDLAGPKPPMTTTTAPQQPRPCAATEMAFRANAASSSYRSGTPVPVSASVRNVGQSPCVDKSVTGYVVLDSKGNAVNAVGWPDDTAQPVELQPGQTRNEAIEWDGRLCDADQGCYDAPPGTYTVRVRWGEAGTADTAPITVE